MATPNNQQANPRAIQEQNLALRQALLATSPRQTKKIGVFTETSAPEGKTTRMKLFNVGVITMLRMVVSVNVTIGTADATASPKAPYNSISNISLVDYEGISRINVSGYQLWQIQSVRERTPAFLNNESATKLNTMPAIPLAQGAGQTIKFYVEIPIAYDPERDLRGAILGQTAVGDMFLNVTWNSDFHTNGNDDGVYNGAATSVVTVNSTSIELYQDFLMPQNLGNGVPLPMQDLMTVYGIDSLRISDSISSGGERLISFPNERNVIGAYVNWINNGVMADTISQFRLIVGGSQILQEHTLDSQQMAQRKWINSDMPAGSFYTLHRSRPIVTAMYGAVQWGLTFSAAPTGNYYLETAFEHFYGKGQALPGLGNQG